MNRHVEEIKGNAKVLVIILVVFVVLLVVINMMDNGKKRETAKKVTMKAVTNVKWETPKGTLKYIYFYQDKNSGDILLLKDGEANNVTNNALYEKVQTYGCTTDICKMYEVNKDADEVVVYDGNYYLYNYVSNKQKKLVLDKKAVYSDISIFSYDGLSYGLDVKNASNLHDFYNLAKEKFAFDFKYDAIYGNGMPTLLKNEVEVYAASETMGEYYLINYVTKVVKHKFSAFVTSFGGKDNLFYKEASLDTGYYKIYNNNYKLMFEGKTFKIFGASDNGVLAIASGDDGAFSTYNNDGVMIKKSKTYKQVGLIADNYVGVVDEDNYLKLVDYDGNVVAKYIKLENGYTFLSEKSGIFDFWDKKGIFLIVQNNSVQNGQEGCYIRYYFIPKTNEKGNIDINNL